MKQFIGYMISFIATTIFAAFMYMDSVTTLEWYVIMIFISVHSGLCTYFINTESNG